MEDGWEKMRPFIKKTALQETSNFLGGDSVYECE